MKTAAVIQARMGSSRLPGKVLRRLGDRTVLDWVLRAASIGLGSNAVIVATTTAPEDDVVVEAAKQAGVRVSRGDEQDVLGRFLQAASEHGLQGVVRLTADCPLLDPGIVRASSDCLANLAVDYVTTVEPRTLPRGLDVEAVTVEALQRASEAAVGADRVHVTSFIAARPTAFTTVRLTFSPAAAEFRVTLDTEDDARALDAIVDELGDRVPSWQSVVAILQSRADIVSLNAHVRQKGVAEG